MSHREQYTPGPASGAEVGENEFTIPVPEAIRKIANSEHRKLAWHFFVFFSRMEYALKRSGRYLKPGSADAQPNWDKFGSEHDGDFKPDDLPELKRAVEYFRQNPPRKQIVVGGGLNWSAPQSYAANEPLLKWLLLMIRCVRNNLFHGGKFPMIPISDPSRDRDLLVNAIIILRAALALDVNVQQQFERDI